MKNFMGAIPVFDANMTVAAYWLCERNGSTLFESADNLREVSTSTEALELVQSLGIGPFAGDLPLMIELSEYQLLIGVPTEITLPPSQVVCVIGSDLPDNSIIEEKCETLKRLGYTLALNKYGMTHTAKKYANLADWVIIDYSEFPLNTLVKEITQVIRRKKVLVSNISDSESFGKIKNFSSALFSGFFYTQPVTKNMGTISPLKINLITLLNQVNNEDFDLLSAAGTIERDLSLSVSLLKFLNSLSGGKSKRIDSIRNAVAILGQKEVRRWSTIAISLKLAEDKPSEITRISLIRAKFAESLATAFEMGMLAPSLFMAGLFSMLNVILQKPMQNAVKEIDVDVRIKAALADQSGPLYKVLDLIYSYERGDWDKVAISMVRNNIKIDAITNAFIDSLVWYKALLDSIEGDEEN